MRSMMLSRRLMFSILVPVVLVFAALITLITLQLNNTLPALYQQIMQEELEARSDEVSRWLVGYEQWLWSLAQSPELSQGDLSAAEISEWLNVRKLRDPAIDHLFLTDSDGLAVVSNGNSDVDLSSRGYFKAIMSGAESYIADPIISKTSGLPVAVIAVPIKRNGQVHSMLSATITVAELSTIANQLSKGRGDFGWVVSHGGLIIGHPEDDVRMTVNITEGDRLGYKGLSSASQEVLSGNSGIVHFSHHDGTELVSAYAPIKHAPGWVVGVSVPEAVFSEQTNALLSKVIMIMGIALLLLGTIVSVLASRLTAPVNEMAHMLDDIAQGEGDLTQRLPVVGKDELTQLAIAFNRFTDRIHQLMIQVAETTVNLNNSANALQQGGQEMQSNVHRQQSEVDQIAAAMNEMESTVREVAQHAQTASTAAQEGNSQIREGSMRVGRVREVIAEQAEMIRASAEDVSALQESGDQIGQVMTVIRGIAEQTNLLALNAAIEAARAGDAGRGFAVVSDEVRQLAGRTHESTQQIEQTVEALQERIGRAVSAMHSSNERSQQSVQEAQAAHEALQFIRDAIDNIEGMNLQIAAATEEQSATAGELNRNLGCIVEVSNTTLSHTQAAAGSIKELFAQAEALQTSVGRFKL